MHEPDRRHLLTHHQASRAIGGARRSSALVAAGLASLLALSAASGRASTAGIGTDRELLWASTIAGPCSGETGQDVVVLPDHRFYLLANYGCLDFDGDGKADITAEGSQDPLVAKFNADGYVEWLRAPRARGFDTGTAIALDGHGGVYAQDCSSGAREIAPLPARPPPGERRPAAPAPCLHAVANGNAPRAKGPGGARG